MEDGAHTLFKFDFISKWNLSSNYLRSHKEYMPSINRLFISEGGSSITPVFWSLSCEHLGVVCTNPSMWANERQTAEVKEILSMSNFVEKKGIKCFQINPASSLKINLK